MSEQNNIATLSPPETATASAAAWVSAEAAAAASNALDVPTPPIDLDKPKTILEPMKPRVKRAPKHDFKDGRGRVFAHRHDNGGGWVEDTAKVGVDVYIGPTAQVMNKAVIFGEGIRIESKAVVKGHATVLKDTRITGFAVVSGKAVLFASSLNGNCHVTGSAEVTNCRLEHAVVISGSAHARSSRFSGRVMLQDNVVAVSSHMRGFVQLLGNAIVVRSTLEGLVEVVDFGQVLRSAVLNFQYHTNYFPWHEYEKKILRSECFVRIGGSSTVQNDSSICAPMSIIGRSLLDNCRFGFDYPGFNARTDIFIAREGGGDYDPGRSVIDRKTVRDKKWCNANVMGHLEFERLLNDDTQPANNQLRAVRSEELQSPYSLERMTTSRRIVPV